MIIPLPDKHHTLAKRLIPSMVAIAMAVFGIQMCADVKGYIIPSGILMVLAIYCAKELSDILNRLHVRVNASFVTFVALAPMMASFFSLDTPWVVGCGFFTALAISTIFSMRRTVPDFAFSGYFFTAIYLSLPFLILQQQVLPKIGHEALQAKWQLAFFITAVKGSDIGGFLVGHYLGRRRLAPRISPGKTWEGAIAGVVFADLLCVLLTWLAPHGSFQAASSTLSFSAILLAVASQGGDLFESYLKRLAKIKDSGSLVGLGGVLDLFDSILGAGIVFWILLQARMF